MLVSITIQYTDKNGQEETTRTLMATENVQAGVLEVLSSDFYSALNSIHRITAKIISLQHIHQI